MSTTDADSAAASRFQSLNLGNDDAAVKEEKADYSTLHLSDLESNILDLYDRLQRLNFEMAHLSAQSTTQNIMPGQDITEDILASSQKDLLEAQARYNLKNKIVESVLIANPILKAVHSGTNATPIERDIAPLISARDAVSISLTSTSQSILTSRVTLRETEVQNIQLGRQNQEKAQKMMQLAEEAGSDKKEVVEGEARERIEEMEAEVKSSKQRWRVMKGTASAVVAGSGVDWARDDKLRGLVLEVESDED